jgi:hypothetical protein
MLASEAVQVAVRVMSPYIGDTMARSAAETHCARLGVDVADGAISPEQLDLVLTKLGSGLNVFLGRDKSASVIAEVRRQLELAGGRS